ncbi:LacI family DNA-binding transcriptional regulator [Vallitalea okinawensis]|uniref:LacI family DNA-binding transcriptional regulator n=1 Tax=Vallitalea okinawensis TaxID=2078660 RepID=UPI000CFC3F3C|nr:LacI family DNA-binding transcriptional regulator [Vallitalea okinawensis]
MRVTINDVAQRAGVSKATVSNVFSGKRPISEEVQKKVLEVAKELHYKPNYFAKSLVTRETRIIGLCMQGENVKLSSFHLSLLNGVLKGCYAKGYRVLVNALASRFNSKTEFIAADPVDGDILLDPAEDDKRIKERIEKNIPLILIGKPPKKYEKMVSYVDNDNVSTAENLTNHLIELGHREILFLNAPQDKTVSHDREKGYKLAVLGSNQTPNLELLKYKPDDMNSIEYGYLYAKKALEENKNITAIIADSGKVVGGIYDAVRELGLTIPDDLSVAVFSDGNTYGFDPSLTEMDLNPSVLGEEAVKMLIEQINSEKKVLKRVFISSEIKINGSTGPKKVG